MPVTPYLSIVVASRNDSHGGNMLKRMQLFVRGLMAQCKRYDFPIELLIVEWNPPADKPGLQEVLPQPGRDDRLTLRYIEVPPELHQRYKRSKEIPLFQMIAKNVGIRRAKGAFILCTNVDLLFSDPLFRIFTERTLRKDTYYRANRCDVPDGIDLQWDLDQQLTWCGRNVIRRLGMDARFGNTNLEQFGLNDKSRFKKWMFNKMALWMKIFWPPEKREYYGIDSFACGDFTLMSREGWMEICGYLELDLYSIHIDTLGLISAKALGYRQHVFARHECTYHIDHPMGWEAMNPLEKIRFLEERPGIDYGLIYNAGMFALKEKRLLNLNRDDWGFSRHELKESVFPK